MSCSVCGKPVDPKYRPFCSRRCADVDLAHWLRGDYAIPVVDEAPDDDDGEGDAGDFPAGSTGPSGRPH